MSKLAPLTREAIQAHQAAADYKLMATNEYGERKAVAHGSYSDMKELAADSRPECDVSIEKNR